uniref:Adenosine monophosphate-protein transferase n=1 Tax=candidate division WOR-3 bacterium TaxID=2052148 RepID=A0A7V3ZUD7_UNCW3
MEIKIIEVKKPAEVNVILGQSHFIKTIEDLYEVIVSTNPQAKFGIAFCESSGPCLVRSEGNDEDLKKLAIENALNIGAGHSFIIFLKDAYPINILNGIKQVCEVCNLYAATANPLKVIIVDDGEGRGILGVIDGFKPKGVEKEEDIEKRKKFLREIKYKL